MCNMVRYSKLFEWSGMATTNRSFKFVLSLRLFKLAGIPFYSEGDERTFLVVSN